MGDHFNKLTPAEHERLALLMEECGEIIQAIGKIQRHGYESFHPDFPEQTNREDLEKEVGHFELALQKLLDARDLNGEDVWAYKFAKSKQIGRYLHHQG